MVAPRVANDVGFTPIPSAGYPAQTDPVALKDRSELAPWGVVGRNNTDEANSTSFHTNVLAIEVVGDRVYVGGRFTGVQNGPGAAQIAQPWLAAFDLNGNWISSFTPRWTAGCGTSAPRPTAS